MEVTIPGVYPAPDGATDIHMELDATEYHAPCDTLKAAQVWSQVPVRVELRGWRPGDHYRPAGQSQDQKVKEMFQRLRVPSWRRPLWPIVAGEGKILWARDFGIAADFAPGSGPGPKLRIWEADRDGN
jgi:tRNA(Ile)-lysidine synthase